MPGKAIAFEQTFVFMKQHPQKIIFGDGIANFSSKLAFRATALKIGGGYFAKWEYISSEFLENHLDIYLYFFSNQKGLHSVINAPDSEYDQLFAEYGIFGLLAFGIFYTGFFVKKAGNYSYALPLVFLVLGFVVIGYWFEQLSVVVFFELLMFLNIKERKIILSNEK